MKTITNDLKNNQTLLSQKYWKQILLSRAEWNGGTNKYDWTTAINIQDYLIKINPIAWKLDTSALNVWKTSNVTFEVDNRNDEWDLNNTDGIFYGYLARGSKIQIQAGNYLADGTQELMYVFTGIIDNDIDYTADNKIARIYVSGLEKILERSDAENVSTQVTAENMGTGNGVLVDFTTANNGVGRFDEVRINAVVQKRGEDYDISQLNEKTSPGKITFKTPPASGTIWGDYIYWYQDQTIEWIIEELVKEAGFTDYDISSVVFPNDVIVTWIENQTSGEFDQGIAQAVDVVNDELKLFEEGDFVEVNDTATYTATTTWTDTLGFGQNTTHILFRGSGTSSWTLEILDVSDVVIKSWAVKFSVPFIQVFERDFDLSTVLNYGDTYKVRRRLGSPFGTTTQLIVSWPALKYGEYGKFESQTRDCTASVKSFGKLTYGGSIPAGSSVVFKTATSTDDITYDAEVQIGATGDILSALKRYIKYFAYFNSDGAVNPTIDSVSVEYATTEIDISLVNLTDLTCKSAIEQLALMPDYEWGFDTSGRFFFRSKITNSVPIMRLTEDVNRIQIINYTYGYDRVYNQIEATFGIYTEMINPITEGESRPHSFDKYGIRKLNVSGGNLLGDEGVNVALGVVERFYATYKDPKLYSKSRIKFLPQLDLSDVVNMIYTGYASKVFDINFKILGITLNLENWFLELELQEA